MSNELTQVASLGPVSTVFAGTKADNDELGAGVASSYGIVGIKGKTWSIRYQGNEQVLLRDDGDGPRNSVEVVLLKASPKISKIYYPRGYVEGSNEKPDCWSANGETPDPSVQNKQSPTCANCPMNAWGSKITDAGKESKACTDSRRVAVSPLADIRNELFGGPMLLRIPAASLKDLKQYGEVLNSHQYPYYAVATRIAFDVNEAYPKLVFSAIRPLTDQEAQSVMELREDKRTGTVLNETVADLGAPQGASQPSNPVSPFEQPPQEAPQAAEPAPTFPPPPQPASAPQAAPTTNPFGPVAPAAGEQAAPAQAPAQEPPANPFGGTVAPVEKPPETPPGPEPEAAQAQETSKKPDNSNGTFQGEVPASFDDLLDNILG